MVLLGINKFDGLHDDLKIIIKNMSFSETNFEILVKNKILCPKFENFLKNKEISDSQDFSI